MSEPEALPIIELHSSFQLKSLAANEIPFIVRFYGPERSTRDAQLVEVINKLNSDLSGKGLAKFGQVDGASHQDILEEFGVKALPAVIYFSEGVVIKRAESYEQLGRLMLSLLQDVKARTVQQVSGASGSGSSGSSGSENWRGADLPRGYSDITNQVELQRCELLNVDSEGGNVRTLFETAKPSALSGGKGTAKDWVESDTDEQLMLFMPFQSMLKLHTIQITSNPPQDNDDDDDDEAPMRPRRIKLFSNKPHNLGFDEAEDMTATQVIELTESDWNAQGTANIALRYVKFQNINSLVMFVVDGDGDSEKVRIDRIRLIGEAGEKREMGKLEKIGDEPGE
ncbi:hypothetical protein OQA88_1667 [Cercophora sp. LCS_1]